MDKRKNPFAPGAGTPPPELAGRTEVVDGAALSLHRIRDGRAARSYIFYGLRGVGKTVLINKIRLNAEAEGFATIPIEAPEGGSLPGMLIPAIRSALIRLSLDAQAKSLFDRAKRALASFAKACKVKYEGVEISLDLEPEAGLADSGRLDLDLADLFMALGEAAKKRKTAVAIFIDELQYVPEAQLTALIAALHHTNQRQVPITLNAAGLPQLLGQLGQAKSYAERLFEFSHVDKLPYDAAASAITKPIAREGAQISKEATDEIVTRTQGYPYFLQEWGKNAWDIAERSPITGADARNATIAALAELDAGFFRVRFDRLTPSEKRYMRAMAELGPGPHRSGEIADALGKAVQTVAPVRNGLIKKGMIFAPSHGDTAFTVPLFDEFMKRTMPKI